LYSFKKAVMKYYVLITALLLSSFSWGQEWTKQYDNYDDFNNGLALVSKAGKKGYVNQQGKLVVPLDYDDAMHFSDGMAAVKKGGKWGFLDSTGKEVIPCQYEDANSFASGLGIVAKNGRRKCFLFFRRTCSRMQKRSLGVYQYFRR
jgi:hypothetical protein